MLKNYFKITLRHLWRNRLFTSLNLLGLSVGISTAWVIFTIVSYEYSFNASVVDADRVFQIVTSTTNGESVTNNTGVQTALFNALENDLGNNLDAIIPFFERHHSKISVNNFIDDNGIKIRVTNSDYFDTFNVQWLAGSPATALIDPSSLILTKEKADVFFPNINYEDVINKTVILDDSVFYKVSGVVAGYSSPTDFADELFAALNNREKTGTWNGISSSDYLLIQLKSGQKKSIVQSQINNVVQRNAPAFFNDGPNKTVYEMISMPEVHFTTDYPQGRKVNPVLMQILIAVAGFMLFLAVANYVNLSTALIPYRAKEIGIRKTLGSGRKTLILSFFAETFILVSFATLISWLLSDSFFRTYDFAIPDENMMAFSNTSLTLSFIAGLVIIITLLSGLYPGIIISKFQPAQILRGMPDGKNEGGFSVRKALIVAQFTVSVFFIIGGLTVSKQLGFLLNDEIGFDREAMLTTYLPRQTDSTDSKSVFANELKRLKSVKSVALGDKLISNGTSTFTFQSTADHRVPVERSFEVKVADPGVVETYGLKIVAGRNYAKSDTVKEYVVNEAATKALGFKNANEAIGKLLINGPDKQFAFPIVGVVKDFHTASFYKKITPVVLCNNQSEFNAVSIKLNTEDPASWQEDISEIAKIWSAFYPADTFNPIFYDEVIENMYVQEVQLSQLVYLATFITILISCLGLFGLSVLSIQQRNKEIGIRKVLGASVVNLVTMLSKNFVVLILISFIISLPFIYFVTKSWLETFAYQIESVWSVYIIAFMLTLFLTLLTVSYQAVKTALMNPVKSLQSE